MECAVEFSVAWVSVPRRVPGGAIQQPVLRRGEDPWKGQMVFVLYFGASSVTDVTPTVNT